MPTIVASIIGACAVVAAALIGARHGRQTAPPTPPVEPATDADQARRREDTDALDELKGRWYSYYLTADGAHSTEPFWVHGLAELKINGGRISGQISNLDMPYTSELKGEIRGNRVLFTESSSGQLWEFASMIFSNVTPARLADRSCVLFGLWVGFDLDDMLTAAPIVLSRQEIQPPAPNSIVTGSRPNSRLVPLDRSYQPY